MRALLSASQCQLLTQPCPFRKLTSALMSLPRPAAARAQNMLPQLGGYLCHGSKINLARCEKFIQVGT
jgi:hypothetical protein